MVYEDQQVSKKDLVLTVICFLLHAALFGLLGAHIYLEYFYVPGN